MDLAASIQEITEEIVRLSRTIKKQTGMKNFAFQEE